MQDDLRHDLQVRTRLPIVQKEQVDVGVWVEFATAVTAERQHRQALVELGKAAIVLGRRINEQRSYRVIDGGGQFADDFAAAGAGEMPRLKGLPHLVQVALG